MYSVVSAAGVTSRARFLLQTLVSVFRSPGEMVGPIGLGGGLPGFGAATEGLGGGLAVLFGTGFAGRGGGDFGFGEIGAGLCVLRGGGDVDFARGATS
jgi:hypothetical protein